jgi:protein TonB
MIRRLAGISLAVMAHAVILLFGGLLFVGPDPGQVKAKEVAEVDLVETDKPADRQEAPAEEQAEPVEPDEILEESSPMPDLRELATLDAAAAAPALDAMSLSALADALAGTGGAAEAGFFSHGVSLSSGGRIGGTGTAVEGAASFDPVFALADLDQKPRPIFQATPSYPYEMRRRKVEGTVQMMFVVNEEGRVVQPTVEKSSHQEFERAALDAVRQWTFEPAVRAGRKVPCRMRVPLRFSAS